MQVYSGTGTLRFEDGTEIVGSFDVEIVGNGDMSARLSPETSPFAFWNRISEKADFQFTCGDGSVAYAERAMLVGVGEHVKLKLPILRVAGIPRKRHASISRYQLANCVFAMGSHQTKYPRGGGSWNAIETKTDDAVLRIVKIDAYDQALRELQAQKRGGVTAILEVSSSTDSTARDRLATAVCNLLCFATKNTVRWISREQSSGDERSEIEYFSPAVYEVRELRSLIPAIPSSGLHPLHLFLQSTLLNYSALDEQLGLESTFGWLIEAEFSMPIQPKFILAFIAIERLSTRLLKGKGVAKVFLSPNFPDKIDGPLGTQLVGAIDSAVGPLDEETRTVLPKKLKELNRPTIAACVDALCKEFDIVASTTQMTRLRNRLTHAGDLGEFDFREALDLYVELSHILDVCILKALRLLWRIPSLGNRMGGTNSFHTIGESEHEQLATGIHGYALTSACALALRSA
jgi:hypothetical protein